MQFPLLTLHNDFLQEIAFSCSSQCYPVTLLTQKENLPTAGGLMKQPVEQDPHSMNALGSLQSLASDTKQGCLEM